MIQNSVRWESYHVALNYFFPIRPSFVFPNQIWEFLLVLQAAPPM